MVAVLEQALTTIHAGLPINLNRNYYEAKLYIDSQKS